MQRNKVQPHVSEEIRLELFGGTYFKAICLINKATGIWFTHSPLPGSLPQSLLVRYGTLSILQNLGDCFNKAQFISLTTRGHSSNTDFSNCRSNFQVSLILVFSTDKDEEIRFPLRQEHQGTYRRHSLNSFPVSLSDIESQRLPSHPISCFPRLNFTVIFSIFQICRIPRLTNGCMAPSIYYVNLTDSSLIFLVPFHRSLKNRPQITVKKITGLWSPLRSRNITYPASEVEWESSASLQQ